MDEHMRNEIIKAVYEDGQPPEGGNPFFDYLLEVIENEMDRILAEAWDRQNRRCQEDTDFLVASNGQDWMKRVTRPSPQ